MKDQVENIFAKLESFELLKKKIGEREKQVYVSSFAGSSNSLFVQEISKIEKQIVILLPTVQRVNEIKVELSILGLESSIVVADELSPEILQEKLTAIHQRNNFILVSVYDLLKLQLPTKENIAKNTTNVEVGGNLGYDDLIEYLNSINYNRDKYV